MILLYKNMFPVMLLIYINSQIQQGQDRVSVLLEPELSQLHVLAS